VAAPMTAASCMAAQANPIRYLMALGWVDWLSCWRGVEKHTFAARSALNRAKKDEDMAERTSEGALRGGWVGTELVGMSPLPPPESNSVWCAWQRGTVFCTCGLCLFAAGRLSERYLFAATSPLGESYRPTPVTTNDWPLGWSGDAAIDRPEAINATSGIADEKRMWLSSRRQVVPSNNWQCWCYGEGWSDPLVGTRRGPLYKQRIR